MKKKVVKLEKLTDHITYRILNNTIYLLLESDNILEDEDESNYILSYREDGNELLTFEYKKRNVN